MYIYGNRQENIYYSGNYCSHSSPGHYYSFPQKLFPHIALLRKLLLLGADKKTGESFGFLAEVILLWVDGDWQTVELVR